MVTRRTLLGGATLAGGTVLAACGASGGPAGGAGGTPALTPATIRYLHFDTGQQVWQENWGKIFGGFQEQHPGSKVETDLVTQALPNIAE